MASAQARAGSTVDRPYTSQRTLARWYCTLAGAALLAAGIVGFVVDAGFGTGSELGGGRLVGLFEVNGWHNLVHVLSGLVLLAALRTPRSARVVAVAFGLAYGLVALVGIIDRSDVFGLIAINGGDNALHVALALGGLVAGALSPSGERGLPL